MIDALFAVLGWISHPTWSWPRMMPAVCFIAGGTFVIAWGYALDFWDRWRADRAARPPKQKKPPGRHAAGPATAPTETITLPPMPRRELQRVED